MFEQYSLRLNMIYFYILKKTLKTIYYSFKFHLNKSKNEALLASLPRAGKNFTIGLINICHSMKVGFPGKLGVTDDTYSTFTDIVMAFDERSIFQNYKFPNLWHSHLSYSKIVPLRKKFCKIIVLIREPVEAIKSFLLVLLNIEKNQKYFNKEISLADFKELEKKYRLVLNYSNFLVSWKKRKLETAADQIIVLDNKFIKENAYNYLKFINDFFEFGFSQDQMKTAVEQLDIKRVAKISTEKSIRITKNKNKINFSKNVDDYIIDNCKEKYLEMLKLCNHDKIKSEE